MIYFTIGLPGSGKTYVANKLREKDKNIVLVSRDDFRAMLFGPKYKFSQKTEDLIWHIEAVCVKSLIENNIDVCVHNTHLSGNAYNYYSELAESYLTVIKVIDLTHVPLHVCLTQNEMRQSKIESKIIIAMAKKYLPQIYEDFVKLFPDYKSKWG